MDKQYDFKKIRTLLIEGFTAEELRRFCYDEPTFRPVYDQLADGIGKMIIIDQLIEYVDQKMQVETLLTWAQEQNCARYEEYQPYEVIIKPTELGDISGNIKKSTPVTRWQNEQIPFSIKMRNAIFGAILGILFGLIVLAFGQPSRYILFWAISLFIFGFYFDTIKGNIDGVITSIVAGGVGGTIALGSPPLLAGDINLAVNMSLAGIVGGAILMIFIGLDLGIIKESQNTEQ